MNNLEKILFYSDEMSIEEIKNLISPLIIQKKRWLGTNHPDNKVRIEAFKQSDVNIGEEVFISLGMIISGYKEKVTIGNRCAFGNYVSLITSSSPNKSELTKNNYVKEHCIKESPIFIEDDCWIGSGSIILPGIKIGKNSIVGAGAVVDKDVKSYSIVVGIPAKLIKYLK